MKKVKTLTHTVKVIPTATGSAHTHHNINVEGNVIGDELCLHSSLKEHITDFSKVELSTQGLAVNNGYFWKMDAE